MSDDWDFFPLRVDGQPASIFVDLGIGKQAPIGSYPTMAYLRVLMLKPRENGLSSQEEFDPLMALEIRLTSRVVRDETTLFVGRNTSSGNRDFYFYTNDSAGFESAARETMRDFPAYKYEIGARDDQDWRTYFDFLHPSKRSMQIIMNRRVRQHLEKRGDNAAVERQIDRFVFLPSLEAQTAFARSVEDEGFCVVRAPSEPNDQGQFTVEFSRADRPANIDDIVLSLFDRITELGGVYDGWGCDVTP